ncbi:glucosaminidase domain-containing protein [Dellaglioa algida]|uniref:glucosaminidase domain-containing protein n=1 Tax=Dellaglioa algida TaxID=105612 RepID=UPI0024C4AF3C|nr:glucosaminidase domain-containing protein [Dellaglioa algida]MDK1724744.1 glucosaminidase domain-containing protein [Dellaglioa algida]MDK1738716.1 glucosaminidase domain-containing protein [Dellaglioa algida]
MGNRKIAKIITATFIAGVGVGVTSLPLINQDVSVAKASTADEFINKMSSSIQSTSKKNNLYSSVTLAQMLLECSYGQSELAVKANNYFGIKGSYYGASYSKKSLEYDKNGKPYYAVSKFKKYPSAQASIDDYAYHMRHGVSWDHNYYSGVWRENANDYKAATKALSSRYSTSSSYHDSLNKLISKYRLDKLDNQNATVNYNGGSGSETAKVIGGGYGLYNHVSNTPGSIQQGSASKLTGKEVYLDCVGEKSDGTTWYRIRAEGSSETYWVDGRALKFRPIDYSPVDSETVGTFDGSGSSLRSHVYNAASLSKSRGNANQYKNKTYKINQKAVITDYNGSTKTMYRVEIGNTTVWASSWALNVHKSIRVDYNGGSGSETAKVIGGGYGLYNHISNTPGSVQQGSASRLAGKEVYLDCVGDKSDGTTWYRIRAEGSSETYWVDGRALKFRPIDYAPMNTYVTFNGSGSSLRSHVYNAASLSKSRGNANQYKNKTYKINQKAVITDYNGSTKTMYRVEIGNTTVWASSWAVNVKK